MKKALSVIDYPTIDAEPVKGELEARLKLLEARLAKLDPPAPIGTMEPYPIGSIVYSVADAEATHPLLVHGCEQYRSSSRIIVSTPDSSDLRSWPLASVVSLERCRNVTGKRESTEIEDPTAREYWASRRAAQQAAIAASVPAVPPKREPKYIWAD